MIADLTTERDALRADNERLLTPVFDAYEVASDAATEIYGGNLDFGHVGAKDLFAWMNSEHADATIRECDIRSVMDAFEAWVKTPSTISPGTYTLLSKEGATVDYRISLESTVTGYISSLKLTSDIFGNSEGSAFFFPNEWHHVYQFH